MDRMKQRVFAGTLRHMALCLVAGTILASCSKEPAPVPAANEPRALNFVVAPQGDWQVVRSAPVTSDKFHASFGVFAGMFPSADGWSQDLPLDFMWDVEVVPTSTNGVYAPQQPYYLPRGDKSLRFFAYAPYGSAVCYDINGTAPSIGDPSTWTGIPSFRFEVMSDVADQVDFCTAFSEVVDGEGGGEVPLQFEHMLTGVRFVEGTVPAGSVIRKITLTDIRVGAILRWLDDDGTLTPSWGPWTVWSGSNGVHGGTKDLSLPLEVTLTGTPGQAITTEEQTFMLIPKSPLTGSTISIAYDPDGVEGSGDEKVLTSLIGNTLNNSLGKIITYRISIVNEKMTLSSQITPWDETEPAVEGDAVKPVPAPKVGDFYYSDGTWSTALNPDKTVVGVVFQTDPSRIGEAEREALLQKGIEPHGLVMALKNSSKNYWSTEETEIPGLTSRMTLQGNYEDISGLANCQAILAHSPNYDKYPAFAALSSFAVTVPEEKTTGWFVPSFGQWWDIFTNIGGINLSSYESSSVSNSYLFSNLDMASLLNGNSSLSQIPSNQKDLFTTSDLFLSSTQASSTEYCSWKGIYMGNTVTGWNRSKKMKELGQVRPVLAF